MALAHLSSMRSAPRYSHATACDVAIEGLGTTALECTDVSSQGAFFSSPVCPDEGSRVRCLIPLPSKGTFRAKGVVVRVDTEGPTPGFGVAFDPISTFDRHRLVAAFQYGARA